MSSHENTSPNANTSRPNSDVEDEGCLSDSSFGSLSDHDPIPTAPLEQLNTSLPDAPIEEFEVDINNNNGTIANLIWSSFDDVLDSYQVIPSTSDNNANVSFHSQLPQATIESNMEETSDHDNSDETRGPTRLSHRSFESFRRNSPNMSTRSNSPDTSSRDLTPIPGAITEKVLDELCEKFNVGLKSLARSRTRRSQRWPDTPRRMSPVNSPYQTPPLNTPTVDSTIWPGVADHIVTEDDLVDWDVPESNWNSYRRNSPEYTSRTPSPIYDSGTNEPLNDDALYALVLKRQQADFRSQLGLTRPLPPNGTSNSELFVTQEEFDLRRRMGLSRSPSPIGSPRLNYIDEEDPTDLIGFEFSPTDSSDESVEFDIHTGRQLIHVPNMNPRFTGTVGLSRSTIRVSEAFGPAPSGQNSTAEFDLCPVEWVELRWRLGNYYQLHLPIFVINNDARIDDVSTNHFLEGEVHFLHLEMGGFHALSLISSTVQNALNSFESLMDAVASGTFTLTED